MMFLEFLAVGTWSFWLILGVAAVTMSELLDNNHPGYATTLALVMAAVFVLFGNFNPIAWIMHNTVEMLEYAAAYFAIGALWGLTKWFFWLRKIHTVLEEYSARHPSNSRAWQDVAYSRGWPMTLPPKVSEHRTMILGWMALWPSSVIWTLLHDPVKWVFEEIYAALGGLMQKMANHVFKDFN